MGRVKKGKLYGKASKLKLEKGTGMSVRGKG